MYQLKGLMVAFVLFAVTGIVGAGQLLAAEAQIAKVGNIVITEVELQIELQKRLPMAGLHGAIKPERMEKMRQEVKDSLITRAYKLNYATDKKIVIGSDVVSADWTAFEEKNPGVATATKDVIQEIKQFRYRELLAKQAEEEAVNGRVSVTPEEVKLFYETNKTQYFQSKLYKASHILIKVDPSATAEEKEATKQKAEKILVRAKAGEDFFNLAYYESDDRSKYVGGSLGSFHAGQIVPEFESEIQKMKAGDVAGLVRTLYGHHIIKLDDVQEARQLTFEQAAEKVQTRLKEEKRKKLYEEWMATLKQKYPLQPS